MRSASRPDPLGQLSRPTLAFAALAPLLLACVRYAGTTEVTVLTAGSAEAYLIPRYDWDEAGGRLMLRQPLPERYFQGSTPLTNNADDGAYVLVAQCEEGPPCVRFVQIEMGAANRFQCTCQ